MLKYFSTGSKTGDVVSEQASLAVVKMATLCGFERQGDHFVKVVKWGVCKRSSVMLFNTALSTLYSELSEVEDGNAEVKVRVMRQTSISEGIEGFICSKSCFRLSQVRQQIDILR